MTSTIRSFAYGTVTLLACTAVAASCSNSNPSNDAGADGSVNDGAATCSSPGQTTPGPADTHCQGVPAQPTNAADCHPDAGPVDDAGTGDAGDDGGTTDTCDYGDTMFGQEGDDDDCKYHVKWTSTPICEGSGGVTFTVKATKLTDNSPVANIPGGIVIEPFIPTVADAACDDQSTHPGPNTGAKLVESPAGSGTYVGQVVFDAPGNWTLRFHLFEDCEDSFDDSPHGHAAFHITVP